jgi:dUTP pyrophosphatase
MQKSEISIDESTELAIYLYGYKKNPQKNDYYKLNYKFQRDTSKDEHFDLIDELYNNTILLPSLLNNDRYKNIFLRGYFDANGKINNNLYIISIYSLFEDLIKYIPTAFNLDMNNIITIKGCNLYEFLNSIYENANYYNSDNYNKYLHLFNDNLPELKKSFTYYKNNINAIDPSKNRVTDSGFDLYIIEKISQKNNLYMYDTGLIVQPEPGIYFDLVPRSSIIKKGFILANSIGIIDQTFIGTIKVALIKIDPDAPDLELPLKIVQIIPRQVIQITPIEINDKNDIISTIRGIGEYGSSDKK